MLRYDWYEKICKRNANKCFLPSFLQEGDPSVTHRVLGARIPFLGALNGDVCESEQQVVLCRQLGGQAQFDLIVPCGIGCVVEDAARGAAHQQPIAAIYTLQYKC